MIVKKIVCIFLSLGLVAAALDISLASAAQSIERSVTRSVTRSVAAKSSTAQSTAADSQATESAAQESITAKPVPNAETNLDQPDGERKESSTILGVGPDMQYKSDAAIESFGNTLPTAIRDKLDYDILNPLTPCDDNDAVCGYARALQANDFVAMDKWAKDRLWASDTLGQISLLGVAGAVAIKVSNRATAGADLQAQARKFLGQIAEDLKNAAANLPNQGDINTKVLTIVQDVVPIWQTYSQGHAIPETSRK
jgi:guanyl-specific ribonuclease Sa